MKTAAPAARGADRPLPLAAALWRNPPPEARPTPPPLPPNHCDRPWPINEDDLDLPDAPASAEGYGVRVGRHYLGSLLVQQCRVPGRLSLDVEVLDAAQCLEIGPYRIDRHQLEWLCKLLNAATKMLGGAS